MRRPSAAARLMERGKAIERGEIVPPLREKFSAAEIKLIRMVMEHGRKTLERRFLEIMGKAECSFSDVCHALGIPVRFAADVLPDAAATQKK